MRPTVKQTAKARERQTEMPTTKWKERQRLREETRQRQRPKQMLMQMVKAKERARARGMERLTVRRKLTQRETGTRMKREMKMGDKCESTHPERWSAQI